MAPQKRRKPSGPAKGTSSNAYRLVPRIPRQIESASSVWLDFFQQAMDLALIDSGNATADVYAVGRARLIADKALETFQERWPGVHP